MSPDLIFWLLSIVTVIVIWYAFVSILMRLSGKDKAPEEAGKVPLFELNGCTVREKLFLGLEKRGGQFSRVSLYDKFLVISTFKARKFDYDRIKILNYGNGLGGLEIFSYVELEATINGKKEVYRLYHKRIKAIVPILQEHAISIG